MTSKLEEANTLMNGDSLDIADQRKKELKQFFPSAFTETKNDQGDIVETLDFERLKAELGEFSEIYDNRRERYGMDWPGKRDCLRLIQEPSMATLKPCREESVDFDTTENLFIEGDNLEVLKLLQKSYYGKVKMIYIDPPYNTGKEFIYPDNFSESLDTYLEYAGLKETEGEGRKWSSNSQNEGRFHTKWLNMMFPRLYLARNLLKEDGVIFISIDDNEVENLRRMCDEIFGEENFVGQLIWKRRASSALADNNLSTDHEYVLAYHKGSLKGLKGFKKDFSNYKNPDSDPRGDWVLGDLTVGMTASMRPNQAYNLIDPESGNEFVFNPNRVWAYIPESMDRLVSEGRIYFPDDINKRPMLKRFKSELKDAFNPCSSLIMDKVGLNTEATKVIQELMGGNYFDYSKPISLIKLLCSQVLDTGDIALDFFAGSSASAQAILEFSKNQESAIKFIMVQLPEPCSEKSEASNAGYSNISDLSKERIRRAGSKIRAEQGGQLNLENRIDLDLGFKVLKLNKSNFKQWQAPEKDISDEKLIEQFELNVDHIDPNATQEDLLYELLIKAGVMPTESIEQVELANHKLFSVAEDSLLVHLDNDIDQDLIDAVIEKAPGQFICLDKAFHGNDQLKANAVKTIQAFNQGKDEVDRIDFKTV